MQKVMDDEQLACIVSAIEEGNYSWACVLFLKFLDYNPIHYIPYRTYRRLMKKNQNKRYAPTEQVSVEIPSQGVSYLPVSSQSKNLEPNLINR